MVIEGITSKGMCDAVPGITYRQLDYWCRCGVFGETLAAPGSGRVRTFSEEDLRCLRAIRRFLTAMEQLLGTGRTPGTVVLFSKIVDQVRQGAVEIDLELTPYSRIVVSLEGLE